MPSLQELKALTPSQLDKVKKADLIKTLLETPDESASLKELTDAVKKLTATLASYHDEQVATSQQVVALVVDNRLLNDRLTRMEKKVRAAEQRSRVDEIVVTGIEGEDAQEDEELAIKLFNDMGVPVVESDIVACHKVESRRRGPKPVVVRFVNRKTKHRIFAKKSVLFQMNEDSEEDPIYINDHLSPFHNFIFLQCLRLKLKRGAPIEPDSPRKYQYVWTKKGVTYLRVKNGEPAICVDTIDELRRIGVEVDENIAIDL